MGPELMICCRCRMGSGRSFLPMEVKRFAASRRRAWCVRRRVVVLPPRSMPRSRPSTAFAIGTPSSWSLASASLVASGWLVNKIDLLAMTKCCFECSMKMMWVAEAM
eukprot:9417756-Pyramimonas_sp.AAC.1